jgi:hypothetical protein
MSERTAEDEVAQVHIHLARALVRAHTEGYRAALADAERALLESEEALFALLQQPPRMPVS